MQLHTYLNFGGNCEQAFHFYKKHLGGKITVMMTRDQQPGGPPVPKGMEKTILYAHMSIGETEIMASDVPPEQFKPMRSVYLCLTLPNTEEVERIHAVLAENGEIFMPLQETFFAHRFSMFRDQFGTSWMLIHPRAH